MRDTFVKQLLQNAHALPFVPLSHVHVCFGVGQGLHWRRNTHSVRIVECAISGGGRGRGGGVQAK